MTSGQRPPYPEKPRLTCPKCDSAEIQAMPANNPGSQQGWFKCNACPHMWSQRRYHTEQGEPYPPSSETPEGEGQGA